MNAFYINSKRKRWASKQPLYVNNTISLKLRIFERNCFHTNSAHLTFSIYFQWAWEHRVKHYLESNVWRIPIEWVRAMWQIKLKESKIISLFEIFSENDEIQLISVPPRNCVNYTSMLLCFFPGYVCRKT